MTPFEDLVAILSDALSNAKVKAYLGNEIPIDLQKDINRFIDDYNELLKHQGDGK